MEENEEPGLALDTDLECRARNSWLKHGAEGDEDNEVAVEGNVLALVKGRKESSYIGAAFFAFEQNSIQVFSRMSCLGDQYEHVLTQLMERSECTIVLVSARSNESFIHAVHDVATRVDMTPQVRTTGQSFFDRAGATVRMEEAGFSSMTLRSVLDMHDDAAISAAGAALHIAQRAQVLGTAGQLNSVSLINLDNFMTINVESLRGLDILRSESHPSITGGNNPRNAKGKDGFSLFSLLDRTSSAPGKKLLRNWISQPLANASMINDRLDGVQFFMRQKNVEVAGELSNVLHGLRDIAGIMARIRNRVASTTDWLGFAESLTTIEQVWKIMTSISGRGNDPPPILKSIIGRDTSTIQDVIDSLSVIDWDATKESGTMTPAVQVSQDLDEAREKYLTIDELLTSMKEELMNAYSNSPSKSIMVPMFIPVLGFIVQAASDDPEDNPDNQQTSNKRARGSRNDNTTDLPEDFTLFFVRDAEGRKVEYYRCSLTEKWNMQHGDLYQHVRDIEKRVCHNMEHVVVQRESIVLQLAHDCSILDVLLAFAGVGIDFELVRPEFDEGSIHSTIVAGKHPLLMHNCEQYVPNNVHVLGGYNQQQADRKIHPEYRFTTDESANDASFNDRPGSHILLITGPNYSGKSALLKMVGMLHVMAQIGSFVPAKSFKLSVVDRIFTRIESLESSVAFHESAFSLDAHQIAFMLNNATSKSLLLVDEFGKGTGSRDGASLLAGMVLSLSKRNQTPRTLITTHFLEICGRGLLVSPHDNVIRCEMRVVVEAGTEYENSSDSEGEANVKHDGSAPTSTEPTRLGQKKKLVTPVPLFELHPDSQSSEAYAIACAKVVGVPKMVVNRARIIAQMLPCGLLPSQDKARDEMVVGLVEYISDQSKNWLQASSEEIRSVTNIFRRMELAPSRLNLNHDSRSQS